MLCCIVLYCIVSYRIALHCILLYCIVLYCIALYCIVLYCMLSYRNVFYCIMVGNHILKKTMFSFVLSENRRSKQRSEESVDLFKNKLNVITS